MKYIKQQKIIKIARSWLDTSWQHNQRVKGVAVDCVNFLFAIAEESEINLPPIEKAYGRLPLNGEILEYLDKNLEEIPLMGIQSCDILLFNWNGYPCHVGMFTENNKFIHANQKIEKVCENRLEGIWLRVLKKAYRWRG